MGSSFSSSTPRDPCSPSRDPITKKCLCGKSHVGLCIKYVQTYIDIIDKIISRRTNVHSIKRYLVSRTTEPVILKATKDITEHIVRKPWIEGRQCICGISHEGACLFFLKGLSLGCRKIQKVLLSRSKRVDINIHLFQIDPSIN